MFTKRKHTLFLKVFVILVSLALATAGFSASVNSAKIIPTEKVSIMRNGKVVGEITKEAPLPKGSLLKCQGRCAVKTSDLYLVAEPDTVFSVDPMVASNEIAVEQGTAYFSVSETARPMEFTTPAGYANARETSLTGNELKGYVRVSGNRAEIGVLEGGTMQVETASGEMAIGPGKQISISTANPVNPVPAEGGAGGFGMITDVVLGTVGAGIIIGGGYALNESIAGDGDSDGSPSSP